MAAVPGAKSTAADPQALIGKYAAKTQQGAAADTAIVTRVETAIAHSPMGWLQSVLGEAGAKASHDQGEVKGKLSEHKQLIDDNKDQAPPDAGAAPALAPAAKPSVKASSGGGATPAVDKNKGVAGAGTKVASKPIAKPGQTVSKKAGMPTGLAVAAGATANDAELDGMLNGYTPKGQQGTAMLSRITQMGTLAQGFRGSLDSYIAQGGQVEHAIAGAANMMGQGKNASAIWATNPYRKMGGTLGKIMTGISAVKSMATMVGEICTKLGLVLTVVGLLGMIFPPIGAAVSGVARLLSAVGLICDLVGLALSGVLVGMNGVVLAKQIATGASAEEKAATADQMVSEANDAAAGVMSVAMQFGPKFFKGVSGASKGVVASLFRRAKAVIGNVAVKMGGPIINFGKRIGAKMARGATKAYTWGAAKLGRDASKAGPKLGIAARVKGRIAGFQQANMERWGDSKFARGLNAVGERASGAAKRIDLEGAISARLESSGAKFAGAGAGTAYAERQHAAALRAEAELTAARKDMTVDGARGLERDRIRAKVDGYGNQRPDTAIRNPGAEDRFVARKENLAGERAAADFEKAERLEANVATRERIMEQRVQRNGENSENLGASSVQDNAARQAHADAKTQYGPEFATDTTRRDQLQAGGATLGAAEQAELAALNAKLAATDRLALRRTIHENEQAQIRTGGSFDLRPTEFNKTAKAQYDKVKEASDAVNKPDEDSEMAKVNKDQNGGWQNGGGFDAIVAEGRSAQQADFSAYVARTPVATNIADGARGLLAGVGQSSAAPAATPAVTNATKTPAASTVAAVPVDATQGATTAAATADTAVPAPVAAPTAQADADADTSTGDALPYWPDLLKNFDGALKDFTYMRTVAGEFKKAQADAKQKAVDELALMGKYKEYAQAREAAAKQNQTESKSVAGDAQSNVTNANSGATAGSQGASKQEEAKGKASGNAVPDLPEPTADSWWKRILLAPLRWAKNKAMQAMGWVQEKIASVILRGLCGVSMGDLQQYAGAMKRQQASAHQVADGAATTSTKADQVNVKLGGDASKEAQVAAAAVGECDTNIMDADAFLADINNFEGQLAEEKAHASTFLAQVRAAARAERQRRVQEAQKQHALQRAQPPALDLLRGAGGGTDEDPRGPGPWAPMADDHQTAEQPGSAGEAAFAAEADAAKIRSAADYVAAQAERTTAQLEQARTAGEAEGAQKIAAKGMRARNIYQAGARPSADIVQAFRSEVVDRVKSQMDGYANSSTGAAAEAAAAIIASADLVDGKFASAQHALNQMFEAAYAAAEAPAPQLDPAVMYGTGYPMMMM